MAGSNKVAVSCRAEGALPRQVEVQGLSPKQLHHDARHERMIDDVKDSHNVGVIDLTGGQRLTAKELSGFAVGCHGRKNNLERNPLPGTQVEPCPHGRHSTFGHELFDTILPAHDLSWAQERIEELRLSVEVAAHQWLWDAGGAVWSLVKCNNGDIVTLPLMQGFYKDVAVAKRTWKRYWASNP
jgi:hypothetical protein